MYLVVVRCDIAHDYQNRRTYVIVTLPQFRFRKPVPPVAKRVLSANFSHVIHALLAHVSFECANMFIFFILLYIVCIYITRLHIRVIDACASHLDKKIPCT